jgi:hypothetical protein
MHLPEKIATAFSRQNRTETVLILQFKTSDKTYFERSVTT